jgi:hypothetical protein
MKGIRRFGSRGAAIAVAALVGAVAGTAVTAQAGPSVTPTWTMIVLQNGWTGGPFATRAPAVTLINGVVVLRGAISTNGTNPVPFTLPAPFRPAKTVYVPVDMNDATTGRLQINPDGVALAQVNGGNFSNATGFTSLDGVSFAK